MVAPGSNSLAIRRFVALDGQEQAPYGDSRQRVQEEMALISQQLGMTRWEILHAYHGAHEQR